ncbi:hypothetical protein [Lentzea sp. CC55]|uniref:hypothetical protein n=1 Tax=Lentzea sp. CC55 TaxID=2884909 RepID=UPI001F41BF60|nr:hypothetical protein [Lentzea sp. CC55]MCG8927439.1 hypothetical protein [Lentzea sp. CC55]
MKPHQHRRLNIALTVLVAGVFLSLGLLQLRPENTQAVQASCGEPATAYAGGTSFTDETAREVAAVHAAACAGDYDALIPFVPDAPSAGWTAADIVKQWRQEDPAGVKLRAAARVLEKPGIGGQGGLTFCQPDTGLIAFSRGTSDIKPGLGIMQFPRWGHLVDCPG